MRTLTQGPYSVCYKGSWLWIQTKFCVDYAKDFQEDDPQDTCIKGVINGFGFQYRTSVARCVGLILTQNFLILWQVPTVCLYM